MKTTTVTVINEEIRNTSFSFIYYKTDNTEDRNADLYHNGRYLGHWTPEYIKRDGFVPPHLESAVFHMFQENIGRLEYNLMMQNDYCYIKF